MSELNNSTLDENLENPSVNGGNRDNTPKVKPPKNPVIEKDIMRYKKNKLGANLAIIGLALGCLYFLVLYAQVKNDGFYYNWQIAFDVIYNLFFLLFVFLFSEQVKNYKRKLFPLQLVVGVLQIARICWLPLTGLLANAIDIGTFLAMAVFLAASGACIIVSAVVGFIRSKAVDEFVKSIENGEINMDEELKKAETFGGEANA